MGRGAVKSQIDLGTRYGRLVVVKELPEVKNFRRILCLCDCGTEKIASLKDLKRGDTRSCGCIKREETIARNKISVRTPCPVTPGFRSGRLTVLREAPRRGDTRRVLCLCDCGNKKIITYKGVRERTTRSCGCIKREETIARNRKHGMSGTRIHSIWSDMIKRCENPKSKSFANYGGRGIKVCPKWRESFEVFLADVGPPPKAGLTIDRINNDGDYEPGNIQWSNNIAQSRNRRGNRKITIDGVTLCLIEWCEIYGMPYHTVKSRLRRSPSNPLDALTRPIQNNASHRRNCPTHLGSAAKKV